MLFTDTMRAVDTNPLVEAVMNHMAYVRTRRSWMSRLAVALALVVLTSAITATSASADSKKSRGKGKAYGKRSERVVTRHNQRWRNDDRVIVKREVRRETRIVRSPRAVHPRTVLRSWNPPRYERRTYFPAPRQRVVRWHNNPYYWNVNLGVYTSNVWFDISLGDAPPPGYLYFDRSCGRPFTSIVEYRSHCHSRHPMIVDVVYADDCGGGKGWAHDDHGYYDDDYAYGGDWDD
jgi:hypothetical protein